MGSFGQLLRLPSGHEVFCRNRAEVEQFFKDIFENQIYTRHNAGLSPGDIVFDVGANVGLFTLFAGSVPGVRIFAFEPAPETFALLQQNVALHSVNARCLNVGLGARAEARKFTYYPRSSGMSSFYGEEKDESEALRSVMTHTLQRDLHWTEQTKTELMMGLDELISHRLTNQILTCRLEAISAIVREYCLPRIDFFKIDVQKSELDVLLGIDEVHWPRIRQIVLELHDIEDRLLIVKNMLADRGFTISVQQDSLYVGSFQYYVFATRPAEGLFPRQISKRAELRRAAIRLSAEANKFISR